MWPGIDLQRATTYCNALRHITTYYIVLQHNVLQRITRVTDHSGHIPYCDRLRPYYNVLQHITTYYNVLQRITKYYNVTYYNVLQRSQTTAVSDRIVTDSARTTTYYNVLQRITTYYNIQQRTTPYYVVLQRITTYYNILQRRPATRWLPRHQGVAAIPVTSQLWSSRGSQDVIWYVFCVYHRVFIT